jgi:transmembrane E3 ubiquitin-protein ligase
VAFFKLLIFCVIEMKYMVVIIQARNSSSEGGGQVSAEAFRRQVAMLHLRFYSTLMVVFVILFYALDKYRTACVLLLYSFWVPQIVLNVVTEARYVINAMRGERSHGYSPHATACAS